MNEMNVTRLTTRYVSEHASIKDCLRKGLINYSALAREICQHYGIDRFDAVLIACRRIRSRTKGLEVQETRIKELLRRAKLRVRSKIIVAIIAKPRDFERVYKIQSEIKKDGGDFNLIEGDEVITIVTNEEYGADLRLAFRTNIKKLSTDLVQIALVFDKRIETTSGVVAHVYGILAENGINVLEEMSCWTELMMVIDERDLPKAMKVLSMD
jgi:aspartokinase